MSRARAGQTLVFVGPTLPAVEVRALLPGATLVAPVAAGDVLRLVTARRAPARLAIIDGYFERMAAVWHKELLLALERGVEVWGAASMGALRAAELAPFGMIPVGAIANAYRRGEITDDDEVAVVHAPAAYGYRVTSLAMVNVRFGLVDAVRRRIVSARDAARIVAAAKSIFYRERDWPAVATAARASGVGAAALARLAAAWQRSPPDQKAADARALLRRLARTPIRAAARRPRVVVERTWALGTFADLLGVTLPGAPRR